MKKTAVFILTLTTAFSLTACSFGKTQTDSEPAETAINVAESTSAEHSSDADEDLSAAFGTWEYEMDGCPQAIIIKSQNEAYLRTSTDASDDFCLDENKQLYYNGKKVPKKDYSFEDGIFLVTYKGETILSMRKTDDYENIFGDYQMTGGRYLKQFTEDEEVKAILTDESFMLNMSPGRSLLLFTIKQDGFALIDGRLTRTQDGELVEGAFYEIDGNTMTLTQDDGEKRILTRKE